MIQGIGIRDIFEVCKKRIKNIILLVLIFIIAGGSISFAIPATYQVQTDILINSFSNKNTTPELSAEGFKTNQSLIETYKYLIKSNRILHKVNEMLIEPYDINDWENKVRVESSQESQIISIVVHDITAEKAAIVANSIATSFQQEVKNVMKLENVYVLKQVSAKDDGEMVKPPIAFYLLVSFCIGILVNLMYIIIKETYFGLVDNEEKVSKYLQLSNLGIIPLSKRAKRKMGDIDHSLQQLGTSEYFSEIFKSILAILLFQMKRQNVKTVLITSSDSDEGKSFISVNLAIIMAKNAKKTVYVDANLRKPTGTISFNIPNKVGITTYIAGYSTIQEIIQKTQFNHLYFIGAGPLPMNPTEILSSKEMKSIIEQLKNQFDVIIIDSSSLINVDSINLATIIDGCIFVINAQKTRKEQVCESVNQLKKVNVKMIGTILNKAKKKQLKTDYY